MSEDHLLSVKIAGLNIDEVKEVASKIREIERRDPTRTFFLFIEGFEDLTIDEAIEKMKEIYPSRSKK